MLTAKLGEAERIHGLELGADAASVRRKPRRLHVVSIRPPHPRRTMVLVEEETMKPRTRTLGAIGATVVTAGLVLGLAFGGNSAASRTTPATPTSVSMPMSQMPGMDSMMAGDSNGMGAMMGSADMSAMHSMMHQMMKGIVDDDALAACDTAHATMAGSMTTMPEQSQTQHESHHGGAGS